MSDHGHEPETSMDNDLLEDLGYETTDVDLRGKVISWHAFAFVAFIAFSFGVAWLYWTVADRSDGNPYFMSPKKPENVARRELPPEVPLLQSNITAAKDMHVLREQEAERMNKAEWIDGSRKAAIIPVENAIEIVAHRGLPTRPGAGVPSDYKKRVTGSEKGGLKAPWTGESSIEHEGDDHDGDEHGEEDHDDDTAESGH